MLTRRSLVHGAAAAAALATLPPARAGEPATTPALRRALAFDTVVNAVATTPLGFVFIGFPRLTGEPGVKLARMVDGRSMPFPDERWNAWKQGDDPGRAIVRLNAMRIGPDGKLWVVDVGAPAFDTPVVPGGTKILRFDPDTGALLRAYPVAPPAIDARSYIDDIRFNGRHAYITDAGVPGLILLDLDSGATRRVLDHKPSTTDERTMRARGRILTGPGGKETRIHADQQEVSPDGRYLYFMPCSGPLYRVETAALADASLGDDALSARVEMFADVPTTGGTAIAADGTIYLSDTDRSAILTVSPEGRIATLIQDERLDWPDAMWIDGAGDLWIPAAQIDRTPPMNGGRDDLSPPVEVLKLHIGVSPPAIDHA